MNKKNYSLTCLKRKSKHHVVIIRCNLVPKDHLCSIDKKITGARLKQLSQFHDEWGLRISEDLIRVLAKTFKVDYEDLWNEIYMNDCSFEANIVLD